MLITTANKCEFPFPKMEPIGDLRLLREKGNSNTTTSKWKFQYVPDPNASMYWPNGKDLKEIVDEPECGFDNSNCNQDESDSKGKSFKK